ncbi:MAG: UDP-N-acetylmuramate--L-alanine ligase [Candidatus Omnitrophota bacterium]|nr:MAG: UDP-N-acetylmuramate--L-alanine ligase [Candidatus Omnitrophota bacterium]
MFANRKKIHLVGIGGIGMSGIAQLLLAQGAKVSGSDLKASALIEKLKKLGAQVFIGHSASNVTDVDLVIYSSAVKQDNPELIRAHSKNIPVLTRAEALALLANEKKSIAVSGAHGKTSTASLISHILVECHLQPTICVGGEVFGLNGNAFLGDGHYFVLEADESDGSFLSLRPLYSVVTNIDREHMDYYRDLDHIKETFRRFLSNTRDEGRLFFCLDDADLSRIARSLNKRLFSFGLSHQAQIFARDIKMQNNFSRFGCVYKDKDMGELTLNVPGRHNICNALAAAALSLEIGLEFSDIQRALANYQGVRRRLELKLKKNDILIFEDYGHHPTEIKATLDALKGFKHKRILAVFQPHRYTRTKSLLDDFGRCFQGADQLVVTDIYAASEAPIEGVTAESICQRARSAQVKDVRFLPKKDILEYLLSEIQSGDLVAIIGAGDIGSVADALVERIKG